MSLIINTDSYITLEEANTYIQSYYTKTDSLRTIWEALEDEQKEILLRRSFMKINSLPFTGRKLNSNQSLPFPRFGSDNGMNNVKAAQVEYALYKSDKMNNSEIEQRQVLRSLGIKKYSIGDLSEEFTSSGVSHSNYFGLNIEAYQYLKPYLGGGYRICTSINVPYGR